MSDPTASEAPQTSDTYAKTLALLRRLLVGNGYTLENIKLETVQEEDLHLPGRVLLELQCVPVETRTPGLAKGNEAAVFKERAESGAFIRNFTSELGNDDSWVDEIRARLAKVPGQGWGMPKNDWELPKQSKRIALILPCDICRGQKAEDCKLCFGRREIMCQHCQGTATELCPACGGSGRSANDPNAPCQQCRGRTRVPCQICQAPHLPRGQTTEGYIRCHQCNGTGKTTCATCQGHGFFCEETFLKVAAQGRFELGSLAKSPKGVTQALDAIGEEGLAKGHAVITPMPSRPETPRVIEFDAILPYGRYNLNLGKDVHDVVAVGMKPVLSEFPPLLDDTLGHIPEQLNAGTLVALGRKYRLIRELADAMGKGENPRRFFGQRYSYGLTAPLALAIAAKLKNVFASISLRPRVITGIATFVLAAGAYYGWLKSPHPALPVPPAAIDGLIAVLLAVLGWFGVSVAGQKALRRALPMSVSLSTAGGMIALASALAILLACAALLYLPETRPAWLGIYLQ